MPTERKDRPEKQPELFPGVESLPEVTERQVVRTTEQDEQRRERPGTQSPAAQHAQSTVRTERLVDPAVQAIETVLEDGLAQAYAQLDEATQAVFRAEGEKAASRIAVLLQSTKVQVRKIVRIIVRWLRILPSVSSLFIEQEAKIKTDRLVNLNRHKPGGKQ